MLESPVDIEGRNNKTFIFYRNISLCFQNYHSAKLLPEAAPRSAMHTTWQHRRIWSAQHYRMYGAAEQLVS